jgi:hypothetical protein
VKISVIAGLTLTILSTGAFAKDHKLVSLDDLKMGPSKYKGKAVEVRNVRCFYADISDYRCVPQPIGKVGINADAVIGDDARKFIEDNCDTVAKAATGQSCLVTVRFTYEDQEDKGEATVILVPELEVIRQTQKKRR